MTRLSEGGVTGSPDDRVFIENAVRIVCAGLPEGWRHLRAEFEPTANPVVAQAFVTTVTGETLSISVPDEAIGSVSDYQRRRFLADRPWRRLVVDVSSDGRLSATTDSAPVEVSTPPSHRRSWLRVVLASITAVSLAAAAALFLVAWRWSPPPRADVIAVPDQPPRQQEAFDVVSQWYDAENKRDVATMKELACSAPAQSVLDWITTIDYYGQDQGLVFPDAVTQFQDDGTQVRVKVAVRVRPLTDRMKAQVAEAQENGGFLHEVVTLADEGGQLKVCDVELPE